MTRGWQIPVTTVIQDSSQYDNILRSLLFQAKLGKINSCAVDFNGTYVKAVRESHVKPISCTMASLYKFKGVMHKNICTTRGHCCALRAHPTKPATCESSVVSPCDQWTYTGANDEVTYIHDKPMINCFIYMIYKMYKKGRPIVLVFCKLEN